MDLFWSTIFPALLAGGFAGQLMTVLGNAWLTKKREHRKWLISERYKLYSEMLSITTRIPQKEDDRNEWTYSIRDVSQRVHVLFEGGTAPKPLADAMESAFQLALARKDGTMEDNWSAEQRNAIRVLRQEMANALTS